MNYTKYPVLAGMLLLSACGGNDKASETTATTTTTAAASDPNAPGTTLDLAPYGVHATVMVPAGTTAKKDTSALEGATRVLINGPKVAMRAEENEGDAAMAKLTVGLGQKMLEAMKYKMEVNEPLSMLAYNPDSPLGKVSWAHAVELADGKHYASFDMQDSAIDMPEADLRAMYKIARTAKPSSK